MSVANQKPADTASDYSMIVFVVQQLLQGVATATLVKVVACSNEGGISPVGTVDVQPLINMMTGNREAISHGVIYKLPYHRFQGGRNAFILDPEKGDIGIAVFASRDISAVKGATVEQRQELTFNPGSERQFNMADGLYIGGVLNAEPIQYIQMNDEGITAKSPAAITLEAPQINLKGPVTQTDGNASFAQNVAVGDSLTAEVEVTAGDIGLTTHKHPTAPTGPVSPPIP